MHQNGMKRLAKVRWDLETIIKQYFRAWNSFDLSGLRKLMHSEVSLRDWLVDVQGIEQVLKVNSEIFQQFPKSRITIIDIGIVNKNKAMAQLKIRLRDSEILHVVDVFEISDERIKNITAYKA
jgi:hypothetical protein